MRNFGPILNLWEGSNQGEGYLRFVKPKLKNIHSKNWQLNAHCEIFNEISLEQVFQNHVHKNYSKERCCSFQNVINSRMNRPKKMFMRYKSVNEIFSSFRKIDQFLLSDVMIINFMQLFRSNSTKCMQYK